MKVSNIRHTGIVVKDLDASLWFYRDLLGFEVSRKMVESGEYLDTVLGLDNATVTTVKMACNDNQMIELLDFEGSSENEQARTIDNIGLTHVAFTVDDIDGLYQRLIKQDIHFISKPTVSSEGYAKVAFCKAPEGTFIELVEVLQ